MKIKIRNSLIFALAMTVFVGAGVGIATLFNKQQTCSGGVGFMGTYSMTAFAEEASATSNTVTLVDSLVDVTTTKSVASKGGEYRLYVTAIDTGDINVSSVHVGYTYNGNTYNGAYVDGETGLSNLVYSSITIKISESDSKTLTTNDMFASQIKDFDGRAMLVVAEIPVAKNAAEATLTVKANAIADFARDFSIENNPNGAWKYGYVNYIWAEENFEFFTADGKNGGGDAWTATGVEIKAGWINANNMTTIAYTASEAMEVKVALGFVGGDETTRLSLRVGIKNSKGIIYGNPTFDLDKYSKVLEVTKSISLKKDDTVYFIFSNEGKDENGNFIEGANPNGSLNIGIYKCEAFADFARDFSIKNNPNGDWTYGYATDYKWPTEEDPKEDFTFIIAENKNSDAWLANGVEIKAGWINANSMTTIAYTASKDINIKVALDFVGANSKDGDTKLSLRIGIKDSTDKIYGNPDFLGEGKDIAVFKDYRLKAGDTIYFIFNNEKSEIPNGALSIKLYK